MAEYTVIDKDIEFVPAWDGNDKKPEVEQIKVTLRYLTTSQRSKCWKMLEGGMIDPDYDKLAVNGIVSIENLAVNGEAITTARQIGATKGLEALYIELGVQVLTMNARQGLKN